MLETYLKYGPGHRVVLPPEDYGSRILGHAVFAPSSTDQIERECAEIAAKLTLDMEPAE